MNKQIEVSKKELTRHYILCTLEEAGPDGISTKIVKSILSKNGVDISNDQLDKEIGYLTNKGLTHVKKLENKALNINRSIVSITALGQDFLDGLVLEKGIEVGE